MEHKDEQFTIIYLPTVRLSLEKISAFHRRLGNDYNAIIARVIDEFESRVRNFPSSCPVSSQLADLGVTRYREFNSSENYRILFSIEENTVFVHVLVSYRQSIQQLLLRRILVH
ncbi:plasmid stabilization protein [Pantoea sp. BL1]|uniref:plasmid stabilization protein n=1 Tax=unclassified Pantoea TaxID=2630326 RepID=UPI0005F841EF|nr:MULTISPECIES: plasmid stabilization protein [unclassified Pantoea]KJV34572.1 plasmid stabilization protein [Pantoea sp. SM3]KJV49376.1 plasmid stabilization protein [Pantoea sp. BL1]